MSKGLTATTFPRGRLMQAPTAMRQPCVARGSVRPAAPMTPQPAPALLAPARNESAHKLRTHSYRTDPARASGPSRRHAACAAPTTRFRLLALLAALFLSLQLLACGSAVKATATPAPDPYAGRASSDLSGYATMLGYEGTIRLVDTTVQEIAQLMDDGQTFVFIAAYDSCPYCTTLIPYVNAIADESDRNVGYLDTRKDPSWRSNLDIADYDLFVDRFANYLEEDEDGVPHLYTPDLYFIRGGTVVANHPGVTPGADDPGHALTPEQEQELRQTLESEFALLS